jgi:hypothetical protein
MAAGKKRDRDVIDVDENGIDHGEDDDDHSAASSAATYRGRPTKRLRHDGEGLMSFYKPHPCAYYRNNNGCMFRSSCSYHHGVAEQCACRDESCPRGHAHRRAPRACQHHGMSGAVRRWMTLGECSFHHGHAVACFCHDLTCKKAHAARTVKQAKIRKEIQVQNRKEHNSRKLYFVFPKTCKANIKADVVHNAMRQSIQIAVFYNNNSNKSYIMDDNKDPVEKVTFDTQERFGFISFPTPVLATACLLNLNGLLIPNTGRIKLERPKDCVHAITSNSIIPLFDTSQLDIVQQKKSSDNNNKKEEQGRPTTHHPQQGECHK